MNKDPLLRYRYAEGLGDIVACTLHSKFIQPITAFITKKEKACAACENRRTALNILFPINVWKLYFEDYEQRLESLDLEFDKINMQWRLNTADGNATVMKYSDIHKHFNQENKEPIPEQKEVEEMPDYTVIGKSDTGIGDFVIRTIVFKRL